METGPLLKVTDLSFSKLIYSGFKKHETVCERKQQQNCCPPGSQLEKFRDEHQHPVFSVRNHLWMRNLGSCSQTGAYLRPELMDSFLDQFFLGGLML